MVWYAGVVCGCGMVGVSRLGFGDWGRGDRGRDVASRYLRDYYSFLIWICWFGGYIVNVLLRCLGMARCCKGKVIAQCLERIVYEIVSSSSQSPA